MRVAVANLTSGGLSGGYRKYLRRLMPLLASDRRIRSLAIFVPARAAGDLRGLDIQAVELTRDFSKFREGIEAFEPDVIFVPTARHAALGPAPVVTMVRNMEPLTVPFGGNPVREGLRNLARAWEARRACRTARRVIAVSHYVRDFIIARWGLDPARVGTVYHGVDRPTDADVAADVPSMLFTAGSIRPARGLEDALRALALLDPHVTLVIAGGVDRGCEAHAARLRELCASLGIAGRVTWAGPLAEADMISWFRRCAAFVMTSRAEACPNIVLEAMSCGAPSVSVDRPPMPEFYADAAVYYPTGDPGALARELRRLMSNPLQVQRLSEAALQRAAAFTWDVTRDRTIEELEIALS